MYGYVWTYDLFSSTLPFMFIYIECFTCRSFCIEQQFIFLTCVTAEFSCIYYFILMLFSSNFSRFYWDWWSIWGTVKFRGLCTVSLFCFNKKTNLSMNIIVEYTSGKKYNIYKYIIVELYCRQHRLRYICCIL